MLLSINDTMTVGDIQDHFAECFPNLRIFFYSKSHKKFEASDSRYRYTEGVLIGDIRKKHLNDVYEIKSWFPVAKVESDLKDKFGLFAQIFRFDESGKPAQSSSSDELTLQQQSDLSLRPASANETDDKHRLH